MAQIMTGLEVRRVFHDGPDVLTWFDLATSVGPLAHVFVPLFTRSAPGRSARTPTSTSP